MARRWRCVLALAAAAGAALPALAAGDAAAGRQKAQMCTVCHGPLGIASAPETPNLAGEPQGYIARQLRAFRAGTRQHEVMVVIARSLNDADIENLAAWFSSIKVEATAP